MSCTVQVDLGKVIAINKLTFGSQIDHAGWSVFVNDPEMRGRCSAFNCSMIRVFPWRMVGMAGTPNKGPCLNWPSRSFDWSDMDKINSAIRKVGAKPSYVLLQGRGSGGAWSTYNNPAGMPTDSDGMPNKDEFAEYCRVWARRYKGVYWEIANEPTSYAGWSPPDPARVAKFFELYKACYYALKEVDPTCKVSVDTTNIKGWNDYIYHNDIPIDLINYHFYPADTMTLTTRNVLDNRAGWGFFGSGTRYPLQFIIDRFKARYGIEPEILIGEINFSSTWMTGADPRNVQAEGVVFDAMSIIWSMQLGVTKRLHYNLSSNESTSNPGTFGFGMVHQSNAEPWLPWILYNIISQKLSVNDKIYETMSSCEDVLALAWSNRGSVNILLINKADYDVNVQIVGVLGEVVYKELTPDIPFDSPYVLEGTLNIAEPIPLRAMSVMLASTPLSQLNLVLPLIAIASGLILLRRKS